MDKNLLRGKLQNFYFFRQLCLEDSGLAYVNVMTLLQIVILQKENAIKALERIFNSCTLFISGD